MLSNVSEYLSNVCAREIVDRSGTRSCFYLIIALQLETMLFMHKQEISEIVLPLGGHSILLVILE
jgi:hypothetical protein